MYFGTECHSTGSIGKDPKCHPQELGDSEPPWLASSVVAARLGWKKPNSGAVDEAEESKLGGRKGSG